MNTFTACVNLCRDPEAIDFGGDRKGVKLRLADNTFGKNLTRFFDAVVSGNDAETANRLKSGDQIVISGTLTKTSYKSKKGKMKGKMVESDSMPFAKILQVTKSETFFNKEDGDGAGEEIDNETPEDAPEDDAGDDPLADV